MQKLKSEVKVKKETLEQETARIEVLLEKLSLLERENKSLEDQVNAKEPELKESTSIELNCKTELRLKEEIVAKKEQDITKLKEENKKLKAEKTELIAICKALNRRKV